MALYSTLQKFITKEGAPVEGASVNVKLSGGAVDAELFATRTGTAKSNPFLTTANGEAICYVKAGRYDMTVTKGTDQITFKDVEVGPVSNVGAFAEGGTITDPDQLVEDADGNKWRWNGNLNYTYAAGENPNSISEWVRYIDFGLPPFKTVAAMKAYDNLKYLSDGTSVEWDGYYIQGDGGGNRGVLRFGAHTEDGGSIFSIDANTYIEANLKGKRISALKFGAKPNDEAFNNSPKLQSLIDYIESVGVSSQVALTNPSIYAPAGEYSFVDPILFPSYITLEGDGRASSAFLLSPSGGALCKKKYDASATFGLDIKNITFAPLDPRTHNPTNQVIWDLRGIAKSSFTNVNIMWCGGVTGVSTAEASFTGSTNWYNTFSDVFCERLASWPTGGTGWVIGSADLQYQQSTTWNWFGGRTSGAGSGTGFDLQGCSSMGFHGHTIEGCAVKVGTSTGRAVRAILFYMAYFEAVTELSFNETSELCGIFGGRRTGVPVDDRGVNNTFIFETFVNIPVGNTGDAEFKFIQQGSIYPTVSSTGTASPAWRFENLTNNLNSDMLGPSNDTANRAFRFFANDTADGIFEAGTQAIRPSTDGALTLGQAARKFSTVYATDGAINTSDERSKAIEDVSDTEKECAIELKSAIKKFKWKDSIDKKGSGARVHFGVGAQTVGKIFEKHGLKPNDYALFCYDKWDNEYDIAPATFDEDGKELTPEKEIVSLAAGDKYGIRYDELAMFIISAI